MPACCSIPGCVCCGGQAALTLAPTRTRDSEREQTKAQGSAVRVPKKPSSDRNGSSWLMWPHCRLVQKREAKPLTHFWPVVRVDDRGVCSCTQEKGGKNAISDNHLYDKCWNRIFAPFFPCLLSASARRRPQDMHMCCQRRLSFKHTAGSRQTSIPSIQTRQAYRPSGRIRKRWQKCDIRHSSIGQLLKSHFCTLFVPDWYQLSSARRRPRHIHMCCQYRRILLKVAKMQFHTWWNRIIAILLVNLQNSLVGYTDICY